MILYTVDIIIIIIIIITTTTTTTTIRQIILAKGKNIDHCRSKR